MIETTQEYNDQSNITTQEVEEFMNKPNEDPFKDLIRVDLFFIQELLMSLYFMVLLKIEKSGYTIDDATGELRRKIFSISLGGNKRVRYKSV